MREDRPYSGGALEFEVVPEQCLRNENIEFMLGMPINQHNARKLTNIELAYSKKEPLSRDICIYLSNDGIRLFFDPLEQVLKLIEVDNLANIILRYRDKVISEPGAEASMEHIEEHFGSTHPGAYDEKQKVYVQSWRGLSFCFPTKKGGKVEVTPGFGPNLRSLKFDSASQPRLTKMSIFSGPVLAQSRVPPVPQQCYCGQNRTVLAESLTDGTKITGLKVTFTTQNAGQVNGRFDVVELTRTISFGDTVQTVMTLLGAPSKVFYMSEDKMLIHRSGADAPSELPHFFFNYFSMGLDVLFDFRTKRATSFVLHTNMPGHYDFGIYARCNFRVTTTGTEPTLITHQSKYSDLGALWATEQWEGEGADQQPVVITRTRDEDSATSSNPFGATFCYGTSQLVLEVMENGHIAALTIFEAK